MEFKLLKGESLNTPVYRGYTKLQDLSKISEPDIFDQISNPDGTQRDIKPWHAFEAYQYAAGKVKNRNKRLWPEIILNVRDKEVIEIGKPDDNNIVKIKVFENKIKKSNGKNPQISRVDGNHRLIYGEGNSRRKIEALDVMVPFCLVIALSRSEEASIFRDINATQIKMNTSHLDHLACRLIPIGDLQKEETALWISEELSNDDDSPFYQKVYKGGKKTKGVGYIIALRSIKTGVEITLAKSQELKSEEVPYIKKYKAIKNFWEAVKITFNQEWINQKDYLLLKPSPGFFALSELAGIIIDKCFIKENPSVDEMSSFLQPIRKNIKWDSKNGSFSGFGGKGGAKKAVESLIKQLPREYKMEKALEKL